MTLPTLTQDFQELYIPFLMGSGLLIFLVAWLPLVLRKMPLSLPIICVGIGMAVYSVERLATYAVHPIDQPVLVEKAAEFIVIISLMGAGLKINRDFTWPNWHLTGRLLVIAMPLTIAALAIAAHSILGVGIATALLLGAALAPTDPVLAADVQIEKPHSPQDDEARFALTSEAGLNDALAFPFVHLAIAVAAASTFTIGSFGEWMLDAVLLKLAIGGVVGWAGGKALGWIIYRLPQAGRLSRSGDGFVALAATLVIYAGTEMLYGYGFLAVFVTGLMLRRAAPDDDFNERLHDFADETERLLMMALLVVFGGMMTAGGLFALVDWNTVAFALIAIFLVRPVAGWISMIGSPVPRAERAIISFFGIRGLGSVFYFAYGINHGLFDEPTRMWGTIGLVILISILLHGITVTPAMNFLDRQKAD
ncbi:cation:proton antiporter [uncultured Parasphingopyxis sp.]|uniref:cation:proton antiporter n=1 Tax=uncultured Parasphingopyxis sp. TaxID=1547918 RepID=UPI00261F72D7|nr:cation:proton antiporter [uncultured Parasphingopyxis sp.]